MKNDERGKETHPHRPLPDISISFESFNVHLSLICMKKPEHKGNGAKRGEFINNVSKYRKIVAGFSKESDMSWVTLWLPFLSGVNRRASCMLYNYLTNNVYHFVNTFILHGLLSAEFHNTNTRVNFTDSVVHEPE